MADLTPLLGALDMTPAEIRAAGRRVERLRVALFAAVYALFLALAGLEVYGIVYGWRTTDWATFWVIAAFPFLVAYYPSIPYTMRNPYSPQLSAAATSYREAALAAQRAPTSTAVELSALADSPDAVTARSSSYRLRRTPL